MANLQILSKAAMKRRQYWTDEIVKISGRFGEDASRVIEELTREIDRDGASALVDHLRLCGAIPEHYGRDSSEEKLYSKYTDALLAASFRALGLTSAVVDERADSADVEAAGPDYSMVGDAKVFRLSRTAKNQKDFKVEAMHGWKRGKLHAMVVCPIYQLPSRTSQIYQQAIARQVCIFSYSHLAVLVQLSQKDGGDNAQKLLLAVLTCAETLNPTKDSVAYWMCINHTMLGFQKAVKPLWDVEKLAMLDSLYVLKQEALTYLAKERESILKMTREDAIRSLIQERNIDARERVIGGVTDNGILSMV